jgi:TPR repeat protein
VRFKSIAVLAKGMETLRGKPSDPATARERYQSLAAEGDTDAMINLGNLLLDQGDLPAARDWYQNAAAAGNAVAMYNLGDDQPASARPKHGTALATSSSAARQKSMTRLVAVRPAPARALSE